MSESQPIRRTNRDYKQQSNLKDTPVIEMGPSGINIGSGSQIRILQNGRPKCQEKDRISKQQLQV